jgi:hypothetical protein
LLCLRIVSAFYPFVTKKMHSDAASGFRRGLLRTRCASQRGVWQGFRLESRVVGATDPPRPATPSPNRKRIGGINEESRKAGKADEEAERFLLFPQKRVGTVQGRHGKSLVFDPALNGGSYLLKPDQPSAVDAGHAYGSNPPPGF